MVTEVKACSGWGQERYPARTIRKKVGEKIKDCSRRNHGKYRSI